MFLVWEQKRLKVQVRNYIIKWLIKTVNIKSTQIIFDEPELLAPFLILKTHLSPRIVDDIVYVTEDWIWE